MTPSSEGVREMKQKNSKWKILTNGIFKENPVLILLLGCCSVLAISVTVSGALGMGVAQGTREVMRAAGRRVRRDLSLRA